MKIYLKDQHSKFIDHLAFLKSKSVMNYKKTDLVEKTTTIIIRSDKKLSDLNLDFLFGYHIFPSNIMTYLTQWKVEDRPMRLGDTIVQQAFIPPNKFFSQKIIFGVRINEIIDHPHRKGFSYETLEGHVEKGVSTFTVEQHLDQLIFKIQTFSTPGNVLTKLVGPVLSVPYQTFCTKSALKNVRIQLENQ